LKHYIIIIIIIIIGGGGGGGGGGCDGGGSGLCLTVITTEHEFDLCASTLTKCSVPLIKLSANAVYAIL
jgi:hypothetical protein